MNKFMDVVPKGVKTSAVVVMGLLPVVGAVVGYCVAWSNHGTGWFSPAPGAAMGVGVGLVLGALLAAWTLCLGYVYADAKRRAMRPVLWALIAALFPHLFGFLLYFALRPADVAALPALRSAGNAGPAILLVVWDGGSGGGRCGSGAGGDGLRRAGDEPGRAEK